MATIENCLVHGAGNSSWPVSFLIPDSLSKKDWLMCRACGLPQFIHMTCCMDVNCDPHKFRVDHGCTHCGFDLSPDADPKGYDVEAGRARRREYDALHPSEFDDGFLTWRWKQERALKQYAEAPSVPDPATSGE